jgi:hypothetical protein
MKPYEENSDATDMAPAPYDPDFGPSSPTQTINTITLSPGRTGQEVDNQTTETIPMPVVATTSTGMIDVIINGARIKNPG